MKKYKVLFLLLVLSILSGSFYYYEFVYKKNIVTQNEAENKILALTADKVDFFRMISKESTITLQKMDSRWQISEPIQDEADQELIVDLLNQFQNDMTHKLEKNQTGELSEYGLVDPYFTIEFKSSDGKTEKINVSKDKNFENFHFLKNESSDSIYLGSPIWYTISQEGLTYFRQKNLYRNKISDIQKINIKSLNSKFALIKTDKKWEIEGSPLLELDQNKVRSQIKELVEIKIKNYLTEGEPSAKDLIDRGFKKDDVELSIEDQTGKWSLKIALNEKNNALYAVTTQPTFLIELPLSAWEKLANLSVDQFRDRTTIMTFSKYDAQKFYSKVNGSEIHFENENQSWIIKNPKLDHQEFLPVEAEKLLNEIHELKVSYFIDDQDAKKFTGQNMIILKSSQDNLVFQLNWGPLITKKINGEDKQIYLARTQLSQQIFALEKEIIDQLPFDKIFKAKEKETSDVKN